MNDTRHQIYFVRALSVAAHPFDSDSSKNDFLGLPRRWATAKHGWNMDSIFASRLPNRNDVWMKASLNRFSKIPEPSHEQCPARQHSLSLRTLKRDGPFQSSPSIGGFHRAQKVSKDLLRVPASRFSSGE